MVSPSEFERALQESNYTSCSPQCDNAHGYYCNYDTGKCERQD